MPVASQLPFDDACYQAMLGRDARFDGCFFTGVTSTRIYCRPVCRVKAPKRENCRFFAHAAQAESAGFRPCMRCRPELAPQSLIWSTQDASHTLALQAARLWDDAGQLAMPSVADVAARLGVSDRHLRRIFEAHLGVSPLQYLQTRRLLCAKQLLTDTHMSVAEVALASGFASLRRFNAAFVQHYRLAPTQLRKEGAQAGKPANQRGSVTVQLAYRPPYDVAAMLGFWRKRQLDTIESIAENVHATWTTRTFCLQNAGTVHSGWLRMQFDTVRSVVHLEVSDGLCKMLPTVIARVRAALDLDADPKVINAVLGTQFNGQDMAGIRVPGSLDGFEVAIRAIVGQQVTVAAGRTLTQRVVNTFGQPITTPYPELTRLFPTAQALAQTTPSSLGELGIVKQRQAAIIALAQAVSSGALNLNTPANALETIEQLKALPGIGDWTAQYIAMRALRWPDAFPAGDVALHNALGVRTQKHPAKAAEAASQAWRPWRSYAVLRAWHSLPAVNA
jgi:AraC family transcriptional regulator, regulatory protein of adaptative response / DNA-3-methyladenine glycosylase II